EPVDVRLREHTALAGYRMQLQALVAHLAELLGGNTQLGVDLVDHRSGSARALIVHGRNLLLPPGLRILLEDDDLGVLPAEFNHRSTFGIEPLNSQGYSIHFLNEFRAQVFAHAGAARPGDEHA